MADTSGAAPSSRGPRFDFPDGELGAWCAVGDVTDRSVRVWARREGGPVPVTLSIDDRVVAEARLEPDPTHDGVAAVVLELDEPRPGRPFRVGVDGQVREGRLAPKQGEPVALSFAFGSCHQPFRDPPLDRRLERHPGAGVYPRLAEFARERSIDFLLLLGDQIYSDAVSRISVRDALAADESITDDDLLETYRHLYRGYFNEAGFRTLQETVPTYLTWDDHDIFDGWGSLLRTTDFERRLYRAAERAYREYQHLRNPGASVDATAPYAYPFWYGDVGFFVLDLRGDRDFDRGQILGEQQWAALDAFLAEAADREAPTVCLGISVPVVHASPAITAALEGLRTGTGRDIRDRWDVPTFRPDRTALLDRLFAWQAARPRRQVVILSGDVHVGAAFSMRPKPGGSLRADRGRVVQWTSSALSTPGGLQHVLANRFVTRLVRLGEHDLRVWRRGLATGNNVGVVEVRPAEGGGHDLTLSIYQYDPGRDALRVAFTDHSSPRT